MNNFKQPRQPRRRATIDGIISKSHLGLSSGTIGFQQSTGPRPASPEVIDHFRASEGFRPATRSLLETSGEEMGQPSNLNGLNPSRAAHQKLKRRSGWRKVVVKGMLVILLAIILTGGYLGGKFYLKTRKIFQGGATEAATLKDGASLDPSQLKQEGEGRINVLLLGIGGAGHDGPDLTDTILIASIDPVNNKASLLSIPRDLWVKMPSNNFIGQYQKINAAYEAGKYTYLRKQDASNSNTNAVKAGFASIDQVVTRVTGIPINYHILIDFQAFQQGIDSVGGVTVNVPQELYDPTVAWENHYNPVIAKAGLQTFNGSQALLYSRSRETSSDFARTERQRAVLLALKQKILTIGTFSNPAKISGLLSAFGDNVKTDLTQQSAVRLYQIGKDIAGNNIVSVGLADPPNHFVTTGDVNGVSIVEPTAGLFNYTDMQSYIRNTLKDGFIAKENATITVLNGTSVAGLATTKATELKSYGYNVTTVGSAPTSAYTHSVLVALKGSAKKYTQRYLELRLGVKAVSSLPDSTIVPGNADFVIILGSQ